MTQTHQPPADTIRFGGLKGGIWRNQSADEQHMPRYTVNYNRSYKDADGNWKETTSLNEMDNLKLGHLVTKVTERIAELKAADRLTATDDHDDKGEAA